jgi:hypothetical protein
MCSEPIFVENNEAPTIDQVSVRPARKKLLLSAFRRASKPRYNPRPTLNKSAAIQTIQSVVVRFRCMFRMIYRDPLKFTSTVLAVLLWSGGR